MELTREANRRRWARPALTLAATVLTIATLETCSYLFGVFDGPLQPLRVGNIQIYGRHDPLLFWSLAPGARAEDGRLWINAQGFRGPELGQKEPGEYRILSLGESTTFAAQMPYGDSYSARLERTLAARKGSREIRVVNGGVPGYSLFQGVTFLRERSAALQPDMVLLYFGFNDVLPVAYLAERVDEAATTPGGRNDWELFEHRQQPLQRFASFLTRYSNLYRGISEIGSRRTNDELRQNEMRPRVPPDHRERLLQAAKAYTDEMGIELVLIVPVYREFEGHAELLRSFAARESVPVVDLPRLLAPRIEGQSEVYFLDPVHPSSRGHRLIAEAIFEVIGPDVPR